MLLLGMSLISLLSGLLIVVLWEERRAAKQGGPQGFLTGLWTTGRERRHFRRIRFALPIRYEVMLSAAVVSGAWTTVESHDVSEGGMCLRMYERLAILTRLKFEIPLHRPEILIRGTGEVRWTQEEAHSGARRTFRTGVQFVQISPQDRERLLHLLKKPSTGKEHESSGRSR